MGDWIRELARVESQKARALSGQYTLDTVDVEDAIRVAVKPLREMLLRLEWWGGSCPECCTERFTGRSGEGMDEHLIPVDPPPHETDCELAALLKDLR